MRFSSPPFRQTYHREVFVPELGARRRRLDFEEDYNRTRECVTKRREERSRLLTRAQASRDISLSLSLLLPSRKDLPHDADDDDNDDETTLSRVREITVLYY